MILHAHAVVICETPIHVINCIHENTYPASIPAAKVSPHSAGEVDCNSFFSIDVFMNTRTNIIVSAVSTQIAYINKIHKNVLKVWNLYIILKITQNTFSFL